MSTGLSFNELADGSGEEFNASQETPFPVAGLSVTIANIGTVGTITNPVPILHPASSATASINDSDTVQTLIASRNARKGFYIWNNSTEILYVKFGAAATVDDWTIRLDPDTFYEAPMLAYTGIVTGIWANDALGNAKVTEVY